MSHPVYPFRAVLKELRRDAGLTVLAAAEATGYGNYERWESGQTRVGAQHLRSLAEAFAVTDELHLLLYAWLVDRLSPKPGEPPKALRLDELRRFVRHAPDQVIDLGEHKDLVLEPGRHIDLALLCLVARYADHGSLVLPGVERSELPRSATGEPVLKRLYADAVNDATAATGRALLIRGLSDRPVALDLTNIGPALASPDTYRALADELDAIGTADDQPLVRFAAGTADDARRAAELLAHQRAALRNLLEAARGKPASEEAVDRLTQQVVTGKPLAVIRLVVRAALRGRVPDADPALTVELRSMVARMRGGWRAAAERQAVADPRRADAVEVFHALDALRPRSTA